MVEKSPRRESAAVPEAPFMFSELSGASPGVSKLATAIVEVQKELQPVVRGAENPLYKSKYADYTSVLEATRPACTKHGIAVIQRPWNETSEETTIETILLHTSGEWMMGKMTIKAVEPARRTRDGEKPPERLVGTPHPVGAAVTYACRYSLVAMLGLPQEDDDGNKASGKATEGHDISQHKAVTSRAGPGPEGSRQYEEWQKEKAKDVDEWGAMEEEQEKKRSPG